MGQRRSASTDTLLAGLNALGTGIRRPEEADELLNARLNADARRGIEPIHLAWNGQLPSIMLTVESELSRSPLSYVMSGECNSAEGAVDAGVIESSNLAGFCRREVSIPITLGPGYYDLTISCGTRMFRSLVISSPMKAYTAGEQKDWGCFLPLYALRTDSDWGVGDLTGLHQLTRWAADLGAGAVGTLPLFAVFLDELYEPSPYRPVSRLFWNEVYLDVGSLLRRFGDATPSNETALKPIRDLQSAEHIDYAKVARMKRSVLEPIIENVRDGGPIQQILRQFLARRPDVDDYARFRAMSEARRRPWREWPQAARSGDRRVGEYAEEVAAYHAFVQWAAEEQLQTISAEGATQGCGLYLDMPIGVHPHGFDVWRNQSSYVNTNIGAPPDYAYPQGQDWALPPLHPDRLREQGYAHLRAVFGASMRHATRLRIDHVFGFDRLYLIPPGIGAQDGVYLSYRTEEFFAVALLESHRHQCELFGENLGTAPAGFDGKLKKHGIGGMWVAPYELEPGRRGTLRRPANDSAAYLNTHDMPTLAAWWRSEDIEERQMQGLIDDATAADETMHRQEAIRKLIQWLHESGDLDTADASVSEHDILLLPLLRAIARSPAKFMVVNVEDLWLEERPQNVPNTPSIENWRRRARFALEGFKSRQEVVDALTQVDRSRKDESRS